MRHHLSAHRSLGTQGALLPGGGGAVTGGDAAEGAESESAKKLDKLKKKLKEAKAGGDASAIRKLKGKVQNLKRKLATAEEPAAAPATEPAATTESSKKKKKPKKTKA